MTDIPDTNAGAALFSTPATFTPTGTRYSLAYGALEESGDSDRWKIHLDAGDKITVMAHGSDGDGNPDLQINLLDPNGNLILGNDSESLGLEDPLVDFNVVTSGDYYVQVSSSAARVGRYEMDLLLRAPAEAFGTDFGTDFNDSATVNSLGPTTWRGAEGNDQVTLGALYVYASGDNGNDSIRGNDLGNILFGGTGNDTLIGGHGANVLIGGDGNDHLDNQAGAAGGVIRGGAGDDLLAGGTVTAQLFGDSGDDIIYGTTTADTIDGGTGDDTMFGRDGDDRYLIDSPGDVAKDDTMGGTDTVVSSVNVDLNDSSRFELIENITLTGAAISAIGDGTSNTIICNALANTLDGRLGADTLQGGAGNDTYVLGSEAMGLDTVIDTAGVDTITTTITRNLLSYAAIDNLTLLSGNINGTGNALRNTITGSAGKNTIDGGAGNDTLSAGLGNDTLIGGRGVDTETGGGGNDFFVFNAPLSAANRDVIKDFNHAADTFRLSHLVMKAFHKAGPLASDFFFVGAKAHDADDHIVYNKATGALFYDSNGDLAGGVTLLATLTNKPTLQVNDFVVT